MIDQYISELLYKYDSVILPGFGAFVLKYSPSLIHPVEHKIHPPSKHVSFDPTLKNNDGILANYLSEKERIPFFDACTMILNFIEQTNKSLAEGKEIVLAKIGVLSKSNNEISFTPDVAVNYNPEFYGMEELISAPILRDEVKVRMQEQFDSKAHAIKKRKSFPKVAVWLTIIVLVLGGAAGALLIIRPAFISDLNLCAIFKTTENKGNPITVTQQKQKVETNLNADVRSKDSIKTDSSITPNKSTAQSNSNVQPTSGKFHLIAASFRVKENAENYTQTLRQQGYDSQVMFLPAKEMYVVSYNSFGTRDEAAQALAKIRKTVNASAWLLNN